MSKKPDIASALSGILKAKRGEEPTSEPTAATSPAAQAVPPPSPAPIAAPLAAASPPAPTRPFRRGGKSSDKANYSQFSVYLRKDTRKKVARALDDLETGQDFSELVQDLLEQWLKSNT